MAEDEFSAVPSGRRGKPTLASITEEVPVPRRSKPKAPSIPKVEIKAPKVSVPKLSLGGGGKLVYVVALIALVALYFAYSASNEVGRMKGEMHGVAEDLKVFKAKEASIRAPLEGIVTLKREVPLSGVFPSTLRGSGTLTVPFKTTLVGRSAATGAIFEINVDQEVSIDFTAPLNFSETGQGQSLLIDEQIPLGNEVDIEITARDVWGPELDSIIDRLETAGQ